MLTLKDLVKQFDASANPQTILRGSGAWETGGLSSPAAALVFGANMPVSILATTLLQVTLTSNAAFEFMNATGPSTPQIVYLRIINASGGGHGAGTFDTKWKVAGNVTAIADTKNRTYIFLWDGVDTMIEITRGAADIPN